MLIQQKMARQSKIQMQPTDSTETPQQLTKKLAALVSSSKVLETNASLPDICMIGTEKDSHTKQEDHDESTCGQAPKDQHDKNKESSRSIPISVKSSEESLEEVVTAYELVKQNNNGAVDIVKDYLRSDSSLRSKRHDVDVAGRPEESGRRTEKPDNAQLRPKTKTRDAGGAQTPLKKKHSQFAIDRIVKYVSALIKRILIVNTYISTLATSPVAAHSVYAENDAVEVDGSPEESGGPTDMTEIHDDAREGFKPHASGAVRGQYFRNATHFLFIQNLKYGSALLKPIMIMITCISVSTAYPAAVGSGPAVSDAAIEPLQLTGGKSGSVTFIMTWPPHEASHPVPYYTIRFESERQPFCTNDEIHTDGLKYKSQEGRFKATNKVVDQSISVNLKISDVCDEDKDVYVMTLILYDYQGDFNPVSKKKVDVITPTGNASCFITDSAYNHLHQVHCTAKAGSSNASSLCCFQNNDKIPYMGDIYNDGHHIRGVFWMRFTAPVYCCSHENKTSINQASCMDYIWPPTTPTKVPQGVKIETSHSPSTASKPTPSPSGSGDLKNVQSLTGVLTVSFIVIIAIVF